MSAFFKMSDNGLDFINNNNLSEPAQKLLLKILHHQGRMPLSMDVLFEYLGMERKKATRLIYKMLHSDWLINIDETKATSLISQQSTINKDPVPAVSLSDVVNDNHIILSDQQGLLISSLGFSSEQSANLAARAAERLKDTSQENINSTNTKSLFTVFSNFHWQDMELELRYIQVNGLSFIITTKSASKLNNEQYFDLITRLVRRYDNECK